MRKRLGGLLGLILAALCCLYALYALSLRQAFPWQQAEVFTDGSVDCNDIQPFDSIWDGFQAGWGDNRAAAFTPFHITPGGGEKYLLSAVQALQDAGYFVTVYVYDGNGCRTKEQLLATAAALRVNLNPDMVTLSIWHPDPPRVRVFFALGNDKYPQQRNIGLVGFFMCQFPFDLDLPPKNQEELAALASYDHVLVNSRFTLRWFNAYITQTIDHYYQQATLMPSVDILHPPCAILQNRTETPRQNIVMLGRFFDGRQSKGHPHAIQLFSQMAPHLPAGTRLVLIGQLVLNHDSYLQTLRDQVASLPAIADRVDFVVSASPEQVEAQLHAASLQWHMTGLEVDPSEDPASREHFGISIVECMSAGVIPIALQGGPEDIIDHAVDGFLAANAEDFMRYTLHVHKAHGDMTQRMRAAAVDKASAFSYASFQKQFLFYMHRALLTRPHRHFIRATAQQVRACTDISVARESPMAAMIIEPRNHYALEYTIYNVMAILSKSPYPWTLHVYHTPVNQQLVQRIIAAHPGLRHTQLHELPPHMLDVSNYNQMMKTERLWSSVGNATKVRGPCCCLGAVYCSGRL